MRRLLGLGCLLALFTFSVGGTAGASGHQKTPNPHVKVGEHFTLEWSFSNGDPAACVSETIGTNHQVSFATPEFTDGMYVNGVDNEGVAYLDEPFFDQFLNAEQTFNGNWTPSIRGFQGELGNNDGTGPAQVVKGHVKTWDGVSCMR